MATIEIPFSQGEIDKEPERRRAVGINLVYLLLRRRNRLPCGVEDRVLPFSIGRPNARNDNYVQQHSNENSKPHWVGSKATSVML